MKAWIWDLDGTICNDEHRQAHLRSKPKNWDKYNSLMHLDKPIIPTLEVLHSLFFNVRDRIIFCTGRQEKDREVCTAWLLNHAGLYNHNYELYMRNTGDYRDDTIVKKEMLDKIRKKGYTVIAVFDDRTKVVDMWRQNGLFVFDCNQTREIF